jgi:hypothetical protein
MVHYGLLTSPLDCGQFGNESKAISKYPDALANFEFEVFANKMCE